MVWLVQMWRWFYLYPFTKINDTRSCPVNLSSLRIYRELIEGIYLLEGTIHFIIGTNLSNRQSSMITNFPNIFYKWRVFLINFHQTVNLKNFIHCYINEYVCCHYRIIFFALLQQIDASTLRFQGIGAAVFPGCSVQGQSDSVGSVRPLSRMRLLSLSPDASFSFISDSWIGCNTRSRLPHIRVIFNCQDNFISLINFTGASRSNSEHLTKTRDFEVRDDLWI